MKTQTTAARSPQPFSPRSMQEHLLDDIRRTDDLLTLLNRELELLKSRENQQQQHMLIEEKHQLAEQLEASAQQRKQWLAQYVPQSENSPKEQWREFLVQLGGPELIKLWDALKEKMQRCQAQNEINGRLIHRGQQSLKQLIGLLKGQVETPKLYNTKGATEHHHHSQTVIKA